MFDNWMKGRTTLTSAVELDVLHHLKKKKTTSDPFLLLSGSVLVLASWSVDIGCPLTSDPFTHTLQHS